MADDPTKTTPETAAPASPSAPAAVAAAPAPTPEATAAAAPAPTPAQPETSATVADTPSLLETALAKPEAAKPAEPAKPAEVKPADAPKRAEAPKPADQTKPAEVKPEGEAKAIEAAKPDPVEYKYALPEGLTMDDARKGELHAALDAFRANPIEGAQGLIDLHNKSMQEFAKQYDADTSADQHRKFNDARKDWNKKIMADSTLGGAGHQTAMGAVARARDALVPASMMQARSWSEADLKAAGLPEARAKELAGSPRISEFEEFLRVTGAGDHPVLMHILHNAARYLDEPQAVNVPTDISPPPDIGRQPGRRGAQVLYDNPRSQRSNGRSN